MDGSVQLDSEYRIVLLDREWTARIWPQVEHYIGKALKRGNLGRKYTTTGVLSDLLLGRAGLWVVSRGQAPDLEIDAAITTRRIDYQLCSTMYVQLIGGRNLSRWWEKAEKEIERWSKTLPPFPGALEGVIGLEGGLRKGWARKPGWKVTGYMLEREFDGRR